jgi:hypothetical protein
MIIDSLESRVRATSADCLSSSPSLTGSSLSSAETTELYGLRHVETPLEAQTMLRPDIKIRSPLSYSHDRIRRYTKPDRSASASPLPRIRTSPNTADDQERYDVRLHHHGYHSITAAATSASTLFPTEPLYQPTTNDLDDENMIQHRRFCLESEHNVASIGNNTARTVSGGALRSSTGISRTSHGDETPSSILLPIL